MKTSEDHRRARLEQAVTLAGGTLEALAEKSGLNSTYLSQVRNGNRDSKTGEPRKLGNKAARAIEEGLKMPRGWMDGADADDSDDQEVPPDQHRKARIAAMLSEYSDEDLRKILDALQVLLQRDAPETRFSAGDDAFDAEPAKASRRKKAS